MREIKFRAWDKTHDSMVSWEKILQHCDRLSFLALRDHEVMQYTGLKDKNGKEIYEGDIIEYQYNDHIHRFAYIEFNDGAFGTNYKGEFERLYQAFASSIKILGNIYESPEQLTPPH